jgi:SAM-dependent methyltransferase
VIVLSLRSLLTRDATYPVRVMLDRVLPSCLRDSTLFMYPFFVIGFSKKQASLAMHFKEIAPTMSDEEMDRVYKELQGLSRYRRTDLNHRCLTYILSHLDPEATSLLDVGCGNGAFLEMVHAQAGPRLSLHGCDVGERVTLPVGTYTRASVERLPFPDKSFDIVTCHHTLEHVRDLPSAIAELRRIAKKQLIITVPCQDYHYYTVDLHLHFFPERSSLWENLGFAAERCTKLRGDWVCMEVMA